MQHLGIFTQIPGLKISDKITKKSPIGRKIRAAIARAKNLPKKIAKNQYFFDREQLRHLTFFVRLTSEHRKQSSRKLLNPTVIYVIFIQNSIAN